VVIADSQCGLFDGAGKRRELPPRGGAAGVLDEDFGLRRDDFLAYELGGRFTADAARAHVILEDPARPVPMGPASSELNVNEPGVRGTDAWRYGRTRDGAHAVLVRGGGVGRWVYLNLAMEDYPGLRLRPAADFSLWGMGAERYERLYGAPTGGEALRVVIGDLLGEAVGQPLVAVRSAAGAPLRGVWRRRWQEGAAQLVGLLASPLRPAEEPVRVVFNRRLHWYEPREGKYLGLGANCLTQIQPQRATILAALPYRVDAVKLKPRRLDPRGIFKLTLTLDTSGADAEGPSSPARHVFHLKVLDPKGNPLPHYARNFVVENGEWEGTFCLGLNEPAGTYLWIVRDALTGQTAQAHLLKDVAVYQGLKFGVGSSR
jgi:hypothetical protein